jgi:hypothetical protein
VEPRSSAGWQQGIAARVAYLSPAVAGAGPAPGRRPVFRCRPRASVRAFSSRPLPPPTLGERRHRRLARLGVAVRWYAVLVEHSLCFSEASHKSRPPHTLWQRAWSPAFPRALRSALPSFPLQARDERAERHRRRLRLARRACRRGGQWQARVDLGKTLDGEMRRHVTSCAPSPGRQDSKPLNVSTGGNPF